MDRLSHEARTIFLRVRHGVDDYLLVYLDNWAPGNDTGYGTWKIKFTKEMIYIYDCEYWEIF